MFDLKSLYQEVIIDHNRQPRNFRVIEPASRTAEGYNPLCGDKLTVFLQIDGDRITDASFQGTGCAISVASASLMTEHLRDKTLAEAETLFQRFHHFVTQDEVSGDTEALGKLAVLGGVREYPSRVKCATLCWHTAHSALQETQQTVSTE